MDGNKKIYDLPCEVVRDILPLYHDGLVSEGTQSAVDSHLEGCGDCRREYELIKAELPCGPAKISTGERFQMMMKKLRLRRIFAIVLTVILTCAVLASGFYGLTQVPVRYVGTGNISIVRAEVYEEEGSTGLFIWYKVPAWNSPTFQNMYIVKTDDPGVWELKSEFKVAAISKRFSEVDEWDALWDLRIDADYDDVKTVIFEGKTIWDAKDVHEVPGYVAAYRDYSVGSDRFTGMTLDADKNLIGFDSVENDHYIYWDLDGNLLYEGDGTDADKVIDFDIPAELPDDPPVVGE